MILYQKINDISNVWYMLHSSGLHHHQKVPNFWTFWIFFDFLGLLSPELFGPGHFVGLGLRLGLGLLRLKSEIRTRTRARTFRNRDFPTPSPHTITKIISQ
jgi:hypothetical protein